MPPRASSATSASSGRRRGEGRGRRSRVTSTTRVRGTRSTCAFRSSASTSPARSLPARRCGCSAGSRWMAGPTSARPCPTRPATACRCSHSTGPAVVVAAAGCEPVGRPERLAPPQRESRPDTGPRRPRPSALESAPGMDTPPRPDATVGAAARYRTLLEINNAVISNLTQDALFHAIAQALRRVVVFDRTAVFLHDPERDVLRLFVLESSLSTSYFTVGLEMPSGESHVGRVFKTQRSLLRPDLAKERQYPMEDRALEDGVRSYVIVPLVVRSTAIGTLAVASVKPNQYSEADAEFLRDAAGQIALALENMKAYQEIAALKARLEHENVYLQEEIHREHNFVEMVGSSPALLAALRKVDQVAPTDATVLVSGETGTGKELVARAIHDRSTRRGRPLVKVNCSAIAAGAPPHAPLV